MIVEGGTRTALSAVERPLTVIMGGGTVIIRRAWAVDVLLTTKGVLMCGMRTS
jgi:hypothetical protein